jgi:hypothetical protein
VRVEDEQDTVAEKEKEKKGLLASLVICFGHKIIRVEAEQERCRTDSVVVASRVLPRDLSSRPGMRIASIPSSTIT